MKLIVGLGNYGKEYEHTRHNAGFDAIDELAQMLEVEISQKKFKALIQTVTIKDEKVILMKPLTYMNLSGEAVIQCVNFYKIPLENILIIHDDLDLPVGKIRIRKNGSPGGQKGMKSIQENLNSQEIQRIRIGIGKDAVIPVIDWVLQKTLPEDLEEYSKALKKAANAAKAFITMPLDDVMNRYNR